MQLQKIIGQTEIKRGFVHAWQEGRLPHAQLLLAPEGTGGLPLALAMAQYLLCEDKGDDACGTCNACQKSAALLHPDLHVTFPVINKSKSSDPTISADWMKLFRDTVKNQPYLSLQDWLETMEAGTKQGNITARECREIIKQLSLKTYEGPVKVHVLWMAEYLGKEGNILLKLIEEPPPDTYLILIAEDEAALLNTIKSRCQAVRLRLLSDEEVIEGLQRYSPDTDELTATQLAYQADGNLSLALHYTVDTSALPGQLRDEWLRVIITDDMHGLLQWIDKIATLGREPQKAFLRYVIRFARECVAYQQIPGYRPRVLASEIDKVQYMADKVLLSSLEKWVDTLEQLHYYIERNGHAKVQFLHTSLTMMALLKNQPLPKGMGALL